MSQLWDLENALLSGDAWRGFCVRLTALGERILEEDFPADSRGRAEGFRSLTRLLVYAIQMELESGDPRHPVFYRYEDRLTQWGGPNPDNLYLRATIDPAESYRVWGNAGGVRQAIFSLHEGDMQLEEYGVYSERSLDELDIGPDGELEIRIAPEAQKGNWIETHPQARILMVRVYLSDWAKDSVPVFHIERVGGQGEPPPPLEPARVARALDRAANWVEKSVVYWNRYLRESRARATPNVLGAPRSAPGGADHIAYGSGFWELGDDQCLLVEGEVPDADYWNYTIHTLAWFESGDWTERQTSLSGDQAYIDADGRYRLVLCHRDPGAPNWIDTEGRPEGLLAFRFVWARSKPKPEARLLSVSELRGALPDAHPLTLPEERRVRLAERRRQALARFR